MIVVLGMQEMSLQSTHFTYCLFFIHRVCIYWLWCDSHNRSVEFSECIDVFGLGEKMKIFLDNDEKRKLEWQTYMYCL